MGYPSTSDPEFRGTLESWFRTQPEILVLIRYSQAAGSKDFEFFESFQGMMDRIQTLPPETCIIAFRQPQLPIRGMVDDQFIARCISNIPDGAEFLVVELTQRVHGKASCFHHCEDTSHAGLLDILKSSRGVAVAAGFYPQWFADTDDVISAVVPDEQGVVTTGIY